MSKIGIIIKREYLSRVVKKSFILTTIGLPLVMIGFTFLIGYISGTTSEKLNIAVVDESGYFENQLWDSSKNKSVTYFKQNQLADLQKTYLAKDYNLLMHISAFKNQPDTNTFKVYSKSNLSLDATNYLEDRVNSIYQNKLMVDAGFNRNQIDSLNSVELSLKSITENKSNTSSVLASGIGMFCGFLIYIVLFVYGMMVMRGVMEEKTNRIAEVIISSVKPFELMMGKVIGIAMVGLTQFILWIVFIGIISTVLASFLPGVSEALTAGGGAMPAGMPTSANQLSPEQFEKLKVLTNVPWIKIGICFIIYFLGGYFLYASLFAAVGSLVNEDIQESQALTFPITMPIIVGFIISMQAIRDPNSTIAVFGSIFPLTSPLVMMARIAYNPPIWQILLSITLLIGTFFLTIWLAGKIYRTGILMYGKKVSWKDAIKWLSYK